MRRLLVFLMIVLTTFSINFNSCINISSPGFYNLTSDISNPNISAAPFSGYACIRISSSDVYVDCNHHFISISGNNYGVLILSPSSSHLTNVSLVNCNVRGTVSGVGYEGVGVEVYNASVLVENLSATTLNVSINILHSSSSFSSLNISNFGVGALIENSEDVFLDHVTSILNGTGTFSLIKDSSNVSFSNFYTKNLDYGFYVIRSSDVYVENGIIENTRMVNSTRVGRAFKSSQLNFANLTNISFINTSDYAVEMINTSNVSLELCKFNNTRISLFMENASVKITSTSEPTTLPDEYIHFQTPRLVKIEKAANNAFINRLRIYYSQSDVVGFENQTFTILRYNDTYWFNLSTSENKAERWIEAYNITNFSVFEAFAYAPYLIPWCRTIQKPGNYTVIRNLFRTRFQATPLPGYACIRIKGSNITVNFNNYNMSSDQIGPTYAVFVGSENGSPLVNITLLGPTNISNYTYGIYVLNGSNITASLISGSNDASLYFNNSKNIKVINTLFLKGNAGLFYDSSSISVSNFTGKNASLIFNNTENVSVLRIDISNASTGIVLDSSLRSTLKNIFISSSDKAVAIYNSKELEVEDGTIRDSNTSIYIYNSSYFNLSNDSFVNGSESFPSLYVGESSDFGTHRISIEGGGGFYIYRCINFSLFDSTITDSSKGILLEQVLNANISLFNISDVTDLSCGILLDSGGCSNCWYIKNIVLKDGLIKTAPCGVGYSNKNSINVSIRNISVEDIYNPYTIDPAYAFRINMNNFSITNCSVKNVDGTAFSILNQEGNSQIENITALNVTYGLSVQNRRAGINISNVVIDKCEEGILDLKAANNYDEVLKNIVISNCQGGIVNAYTLPGRGKRNIYNITLFNNTYDVIFNKRYFSYAHLNIINSSLNSTHLIFINTSDRININFTNTSFGNITFSFNTNNNNFGMDKIPKPLKPHPGFVEVGRTFIKFTPFSNNVTFPYLVVDTRDILVSNRTFLSLLKSNNSDLRFYYIYNQSHYNNRLVLQPFYFPYEVDIGLFYMENPVYECMEIKSPGEYYVLSDLSYPSLSLPQFPGLTCLFINSSNVLLDLSFRNAYSNVSGITRFVSIVDGQNVSIKNLNTETNYTYLISAFNSSVSESNIYLYNLINAFDLSSSLFTGWNNYFKNGTVAIVSDGVFNLTALLNNTNISILSSTGGFTLKVASKPTVEPQTYSPLAEGKYIEIIKNNPSAKVDELTFYWLDNETVGINESLIDILRFDGSNWYNVSNQHKDESLNYITAYNITNFSIFSPHVFGKCIIDRCRVIDNSCHYWKVIKNLNGAPITDGNYGENVCLKVIGSDITIDFANLNMSNSNAGIAILIRDNDTGNEIKNITILNLDRINSYHRGIVTYNVSNLTIVNGTIYNTQYSIELHHSKHILMNNFKLWRHSPGPGGYHSTYYSTYMSYVDDITFDNVSFYSDGSGESKYLRFVFGNHSSNILFTENTSFDSKAMGYLRDLNILIDNSENISFIGPKLINFKPSPYILISNSDGVVVRDVHYTKTGGGFEGLFKFAHSSNISIDDSEFNHDIVFYHSSNGRIKNCTFKDVSGFKILEFSNNITISNSEFYTNIGSWPYKYRNIVRNSGDILIDENVFSGGTTAGVSLWLDGSYNIKLINNFFGNVSNHHIQLDVVYLTNSTDSLVKHNVFEGFLAGAPRNLLKLGEGTSNVSVEFNEFKNNKFAVSTTPWNIPDFNWGASVKIVNASDNRIINNTFIYTYPGDLSYSYLNMKKSGVGEVVLIDTGSNLVANNLFESRTKANFMRAIHMIRSENVTIENNTMVNESIFILGNKPAHFGSFTIKNNTVNGKPVLYIKDESVVYEPLNNYGEVIVVNSNNLTLENISIEEPVTSALIVAFTNNSLFRNINLSAYRLISLYAFGDNNITFDNVSVEGDWQGWNAIHLENSEKTLFENVSITHGGKASSIELIRNRDTIINKLKLFNNSQGAPWHDPVYYGIYLDNNINTTINDSVFVDGWIDYIRMRNNNYTTINNSLFSELRGSTYPYNRYIWMSVSEHNWNYNSVISNNVFNAKGYIVPIDAGPSGNLTVINNTFKSDLNVYQIKVQHYDASWPWDINITNNMYLQTSIAGSENYVVYVKGAHNVSITNNTCVFNNNKNHGFGSFEDIYNINFSSNFLFINSSSSGILSGGLLLFENINGGEVSNNVVNSSITSTGQIYPIFIYRESENLNIVNTTLLFDSISLSAYQSNNFRGVYVYDSRNLNISGMYITNTSNGIVLENAYRVNLTNVEVEEGVGKRTGLLILGVKNISVYNSSFKDLNASINISNSNNTLLNGLNIENVVYGIYSLSSINSKFYNLTIVNASEEAIRLDSNTFNTIIDTFLINDSNVGIRVTDSQSLFYITYIMNGLIKAKDTGILFDDIDEKLFIWNVTVVNQTLSINSTGANTGALWINFSSNITTYPSDYTPINMHRFINISKLHPSTVLDELKLYYNDVEDIAFDEKEVRILYFDGSEWKLPLNQAVDTSENYVYAPSVNGSGKFGLFVPGHPVYECILGNESGTYLQIDKLEKAVYESSPVDNTSFACVVLRASDIYFNANNKTINSTFAVNSHYALFVADENGSWLNNITIANYSNISGYKGGMYFYRIHNLNIYSSILHNNTYAVYVLGDNVRLDGIKINLSILGVEINADQLNAEKLEVHNSQVGVKLHVMNGTINSSYFSNNIFDVRLLGNNSTVLIDKSIFTLTNVSILFENLSDVLVNSSAKPAPLPSYVTKDLNKYILINKSDNSTTMKYLRIYYTLSDLNGTSESNLTIIKWHNGTWQLLNTTVNTVEHYAEVRNISNFSIFGLVALGDAYPPTVHLISPSDGYSTTQSTITLSFKAVDDSDALLDCELYIDNSLTFSGSVPNDTTYNVSVSPGVGLHYWNVTCIDDAGNSGYSETWQFTIYKEEKKERLELDVGVSCDNVTVLVSSNSKAVRYADVKVYLENETLEFETGRDGKIAFIAYDGKARIVAEKSGYKRAELILNLPSYEECYPSVEQPPPKEEPPSNEQPTQDINESPIKQPAPVLYLKLCEETCKERARQVNALVIVNASLKEGAIIRVMPFNITCLTNDLGECNIYINTTNDMLINVSAFDPETGLSTTRQFFVHGCYVKAKVEAEEGTMNAYVEQLSIINVLIALLVLIILAELYIYYKKQKS